MSTLINGTWSKLFFLENSGLIVESVMNGREAVEAVKHSTFDLVLMDIAMPGEPLFGGELAKKDGDVGRTMVRIVRLFRVLPIFWVSGWPKR